MGASAISFARAVRWLVLAIVVLFVQRVETQPASLYAQSVQTALARGNYGVEFMLLDLRTHEVVANTFTQPAAPMPVGSLLKPFLAAAYLGSGLPSGPGSGRLGPKLMCRGHQDRCWLAAGHGQLALEEAIARSCNAYFLSLARALEDARIPYLKPSPPDTSPETLVGLTATWRISPEAVVRAYASLLQSPSGAGLDSVVQGMRLCASHGTAVRIGQHRGGVLAKTGTAPCLGTDCAASGDGLVVAAVPAQRPVLLLLVRRRATTGAVTAESAGALLSQLEALHAY